MYDDAFIIDEDGDFYYRCEKFYSFGVINYRGNIIFRMGRIYSYVRDFSIIYESVLYEHNVTWEKEK